MAGNTKSLLEQGPANALGEGAARFDRLIEDVKASQSPAPVRTTSAVIPNPLLSVSPGEEWSRQFQSQSFGPEVRGISYADLAPVPRAMVMPEIAPDVVPRHSTAFAPTSVLQAMGSEIGRRPEKPRRSWLGRLLHGA